MMTQAQKMTRRRLPQRPKSVKREAELPQTLALPAHQRRHQRRTKSKRPSQPRRPQSQAMILTQTHLTTSQRRRPQSPRLPQLRKPQPRRTQTQMTQSLHLKKNQRRRLSQPRTELLPRRPLPSNPSHQMTATQTATFKSSRSKPQQRKERKNQTPNQNQMMKAPKKKSQRESNLTSHKARSNKRRKNQKMRKKKKRVEMTQMLIRRNSLSVTWLSPLLKTSSEKPSVNTVLLLTLKSHKTWASPRVSPLLNLLPIRKPSKLVTPLMVRIWMAETSELTSLVVLHQLEVPVTEVSNKEKDQVVVMVLPLLCSSVT